MLWLCLILICVEVQINFNSASERFLYYRSGHKVQYVSLSKNSSKPKDFINLLTNDSPLALDIPGKRVLYISKKIIVLLNQNGSKRTIFDASEATDAVPISISCDYITQNVYWIDVLGNIRVMPYPLSRMKKPVTLYGRPKYSRDLFVESVSGLMFWKEANQLFSAPIDGSKVPKSLAQLNDDFIFRVDISRKFIITNSEIDSTIVVMDFQGNIISNPYFKQYSNQFDNGLSFAVVNFDFSSKIQSQEILIELNGTIDQSLLIWNKGLEAFSNPCSTSTCSNFCVRRLHSEGFCLCPTGYARLSNGHCKEGIENLVVVSRNSSLLYFSLDVPDYILQAVPLKHPSYMDIMSVAIHPIERRIYFSQPGGIYSTNLDGSIIFRAVRLESGAEGLAIDVSSSTIYYTLPEEKRIEVARLDGAAKYIVIDENLMEPRGISIDSIAGYIFWADWKRKTVERSRMDGTNRKIIFKSKSSLAVYINAVSIDQDVQTIYWLEGKCIYSSDYWGKKLSTISCDLNMVPSYGMAHINSSYFLTTNLLENVFSIIDIRSNKVSSFPLTGLRDIAYANLNSAVKPSPCKPDSCSHICITNFHLAKCVCPRGFTPSFLHDKCLVVNANLLFYNNTGIYSFKLTQRMAKGMLNVSEPVSFLAGYGENSIISVRNKAIYLDENLLMESPRVITSLDIDHAAKNIYWTTANSSIYVGSIKSRSYLNLINRDKKNRIRSIIVDGFERSVFWLEENQVFKALNTGNLIKSIRKSNDLVTMCLDLERTQLWTAEKGGIELVRFSYDGEVLGVIENFSGKILFLYVISLSNVILGNSSHVWQHRFVPYENNVVAYNTTKNLLPFRKRSLISMSKQEPNDVLISNVSRISCIALYSQNVGPVANLCQTKPNNFVLRNCSICMLKSKDPLFWDYHSCKCGLPFVLQNGTCKPKENALLAISSDSLYAVSEDGIANWNRQRPSITNASSVEYDPFNDDFIVLTKDGRVLWHSSQKEISSLKFFSHMTFDPYARLIFLVSNTTLFTKRISELDDKFLIIPMNVTVRCIKAHFNSGLLFFTIFNSGHISRVHYLNYTSMESKPFIKVHNPQLLYIDQVANVIAWVDFPDFKAVAYDINYKKQSSVVSFRQPLSIEQLAFINGNFWASFFERCTLMKFSPTTNSWSRKYKLCANSKVNRTIFLTFHANKSVEQPHYRGNCSKLGILSHNTCICPSRYTFHDGDCVKCRMTCQGISGFEVCMTEEMRCNEFNDCLDGSDEHNCQPLDDCFACDDSENNCISKESICDRIRDCPNGKDEEDCSSPAEQNYFYHKGLVIFIVVAVIAFIIVAILTFALFHCCSVNQRSEPQIHYNNEVKLLPLKQAYTPTPQDKTNRHHKGSKRLNSKNIPSSPEYPRMYYMSRPPPNTPCSTTEDSEPLFQPYPFPVIRHEHIHYHHSLPPPRRTRRHHHHYHYCRCKNERNHRYHDPYAPPPTPYFSDENCAAGPPPSPCTEKSFFVKQYPVPPPSPATDSS
uniref:Low-density lipoprotein receptor-related protein 5/6 n=1 Tax=Hofstenia miamia TaxID=442651 RepID=A0A068CMX2_HOFMI|nr:low-density lipoprotein receptor-related protein 5/6 [Hofstenia miamia]